MDIKLDPLVFGISVEILIWRQVLIPKGVWTSDAKVNYLINFSCCRIMVPHLYDIVQGSDSSEEWNIGLEWYSTEKFFSYSEILTTNKKLSKACLKNF